MPALHVCAPELLACLHCWAELLWGWSSSVSVAWSESTNPWGAEAALTPSCPTWRGLWLTHSYWGSQQRLQLCQVFHVHHPPPQEAPRSRYTPEDTQSRSAREGTMPVSIAQCRKRGEEGQLSLFFLHLISGFCCSCWTMHDVGDAETPWAPAVLEHSLFHLILPTSPSITMN